jgi:Predicted O-linked N-acetylglucosamine transferase, SPINDLY family
MKHVGRVSEIPTDRPVYLFGAGKGGQIVRTVLEEHGGFRIAGFIDSFRTGTLDGLPVLTPAAAVAEGKTNGVVLITSQFWPEISRQLRDAGWSHIINVFPIIARHQNQRRLSVEGRRALSANLEAVLGLTLPDLASAILKSPYLKPPGRWFADIIALSQYADGPSLYVVGTDARALEMVSRMVEGVRSTLVGFVDPSLAHTDDIVTINVNAVLSPGQLLKTADRDSVIVNTCPDWGGLRPVLEAAGFSRLFDVQPLAWVSDDRPSARPLGSGARLPAEPLVSVVLVCRDEDEPAIRSLRSVFAQTWPSVECVIQIGSGGASALLEARSQFPEWHGRVRTVPADGLIRALRRCQGDIVVVCEAGDELLPEALAEVVCAFRANPEAGAIVSEAYGIDEQGRYTGTAIGAPFDLVDVLFGTAQPCLAASFFLRRALEEIGLHDNHWNDAAGEFELWCRLATRHVIVQSNTRVSKVASGAGRPDDGVIGIRSTLFERIEVLMRLFSPSGFFGPVPDLYHLWEECVARQYALFHNRSLALGLDMTGTGLVPDMARGPITVPPVSIHVYREVAALYDQRGQIDESVAVLHFARKFHDEDADSLACQGLLKSPKATNRNFLDLHLDWADRHIRQRPLANTSLPPLKSRLDGHRIKVAYICPFATSSYFQFQVIPFVVRHDREAFEVYCYTSGVIPQELVKAGVTVRLVDHLSDEDFIALLRRDGIDVALELTGFSVGHRYRAMSARVAPVQISYINHTGTCGVRAVDFCLADPIAAPTWLDAYFTERLYRLDGCFFCFDYRGSDAPPVAPVPSVTAGHITFGCFGGGAKLNLELIALWARLLDAVPGAVLLLRNGGLSWVDNRRFLEERFARFGIGPERLWLEPGTDRLGIMADYARVDISLDTFPYCGGNTIAESLHQGVPVVSMRGSTFASCYGSSILTASGCGDLVANDPADYIRIAADLAASPEKLAAYRRNLRNMMVAHGFSDSERFVRRLEAAYRDMLSRLPSDQEAL